MLGVRWRAGLNPASRSSLRQLPIHQIKVAGVAQLFHERSFAAKKGTLPVNNIVFASSKKEISDLILLLQAFNVIAGEPHSWLGTLNCPNMAGCGKYFLMRFLQLTI